MISKEEVKHIAKLARLSLSEKELEKYRKELSSILDYVEKLKKVNVAGVVPTSHPREAKNIFRKDEAKKTDKKTARSLIEAAPGKKGDYVKVRAVLK